VRLGDGGRVGSETRGMGVRLGDVSESVGRGEALEWTVETWVWLGVFGVRVGEGWM